MILRILLQLYDLVLVISEIQKQVKNEDKQTQVNNYNCMQIEIENP